MHIFSSFSSPNLKNSPFSSFSSFSSVETLVNNLAVHTSWLTIILWFCNSQGKSLCGAMYTSCMQCSFQAQITLQNYYFHLKMILLDRRKVQDQTANLNFAHPLLEVQCLWLNFYFFKMITYCSFQVPILKVVSTTFLHVCFLSLKESTCKARENVFYFTSKALWVLEKIKF